MSPDTVPHSDGESLAKMLDLESSSARRWAPEELAAILEHQLSSVIQFDLGRLSGPQAGRLRVTSAADEVDTSPTRQRGWQVVSSLALRAGVNCAILNRERYNPAA